MGGVPILPLAVPSSAWRGCGPFCVVVVRFSLGWVSGLVVAVSGSVRQFRVCSCVLGRCTRSVGNAPLLFGCSAPDRVQCPRSGVAPRASGSCGGRGCGRLPGMCASPGLVRLRGLSCLLLGVLCGLVLWFHRNVACNSRVNISNIDITSLGLQRFGVLQKVRAPELHATDG